MLPEHHVYCGGTTGRTKNPRVHLDLRDGGNVTLDVEAVRRAWLTTCPAGLLDLLEIAAYYVYVADQAVDRGERVGDGTAWRRRFRFRIPVRRPEVWAEERNLALLADTVGFLTEDEYRFDFDRRAPDPEPGYFTFRDAPFDPIEEVMLFSGGLDSTAGAVAEAVEDRRRVLLVHHRSHDKFRPRHDRLLAGLAAHAARVGGPAPERIAVRVNKQAHLAKDFNQRSRSFLFASLAGLVAGMTGRDRVRFYENGVTSLNLPVSPQVVGARASRTTHPRALGRYAELLSVAAGRPMAVENRFQALTKTDVVGRITGAGCADLIRSTTSCAHPRMATTDQPHCGVCSQCIDRRFAVLAAAAEAADPADGYAVDLLTGERTAGRSRLMLTGYLDAVNRVETMADPAAFFGEFGEAQRALGLFPGGVAAAARDVFGLHHRHARQVTGVIDAGLAEHAARLRRRELPPSCLLRLVFRDPPDDRPPDDAPVPPAYEFRRAGHGWHVRFAGGPPFLLGPSKGAAYLHLLLSKTRDKVSAADLAVGAARRHAFALGDAGPKLDSEAAAAYKVRLDEVEADIRDARAKGDEPAEREAEREKELLTRELTGGVGRNGKARKASDDRERVRKSVGNAIVRTVEEISRHDHDLENHLLGPALRKGWILLYDPGDPFDRLGDVTISPDATRHVADATRHVPPFL